ncbi:GNAT family N-acetyltransferase [Bacillus sp. FSL M8-0077]|uniref:GNAT family N-acetyltransferase n=1 Tax=Bacillus sp. FSL M8-0077 TaxID=2954556 RepID=UPI0030FDE14B
MKQLKWTCHTFEQLSKEDLYLILMERVNVFVVEQTCPYPEIDHRDQEALHVIAKENGMIVAYCRIFLYKEASIGRVLVTKAGRKKGYGKIGTDPRF